MKVIAVTVAAFAALGSFCALPADASPYYCSSTHSYYPAAQACPGDAPVNSAPAQAVPQPAPSPDRAYTEGLADRTAWETWLNGQQGDYRAGAFYWSGQRSLPKPGSCEVPGHSKAWSDGCLAARGHLALPDARRRSEPKYKAGWNSFTTEGTATSVAPSVSVVPRQGPNSDMWFYRCLTSNAYYPTVKTCSGQWSAAWGSASPSPEGVPVSNPPSFITDNLDASSAELVARANGKTQPQALSDGANHASINLRLFLEELTPAYRKYGLSDKRDICDGLSINRAGGDYIENLAERYLQRFKLSAPDEGFSKRYLLALANAVRDNTPCQSIKDAEADEFYRQRSINTAPPPVADEKNEPDNCTPTIEQANRFGMSIEELSAQMNASQRLGGGCQAVIESYENIIRIRNGLMPLQ